MLRTLAISETCPTGQGTGTTVWSSRPLATTLRSVLDGLWEGFAAHREYEHLKSRNIPHDTALRHAFAITQASIRD
jgi:hypothetical protein